MTGADLLAIAPVLVAGGGALAVLLAISFLRVPRVALAATLAVLAAAGGSLAWAAGATPRELEPLLVVDGLVLFFWALELGATAAVALFAHDYFELRPGNREEYYPLLLLALFGAMVLTASDHFASLFVGLETLSVSLYALIAFRRDEPAGLRAAIQYLILAGASSAFLLFGVALVYAEVGSLAFAATTAASTPLAFGGFGLLLTGLGFKLALVPFHQWTPDVYDGAPAPTTALVATLSKGAVAAAFLRLYGGLPATDAGGPVAIALATMSLASMFGGNLLALLSRNLKRLLAYSSIAHLGYVLVAIVAAGELGAEAVAFYLAAYFVTTLAAFGVVSVLSTEGREASNLDDYRGLFWRHPGLAALLTGALLSLAGIPLTAGFIGKFYVLAAGVGGSLWLLVLSLLVASVIALFYYLRVIVTLFDDPPGTPAPTPRGQLAPLALAVLGLLLVWWGVAPGTLADRIEVSVRGPARPLTTDGD